MDEKNRDIEPDTKMKDLSDSSGFSKTKSEEGDQELLDQLHLPKRDKAYVKSRRGIQRYGNSLKNLIPFRRKRKAEGTMSIDSAGLFSFMSMSWMSKFMYMAYKKELKIERLPNVSPYDTCDQNYTRLELLWQKELQEKGPHKASLSMVAFRFCRTRIFAVILIQIGNVMCGIITNTILMRQLLEYLQSGIGSYEEGVKLAVLLTTTEFTRALLWGWACAMNFRTGLRLRSACLTLIYRKLIRVNHLKGKNIGEIINVFSSDAQIIYETVVVAPLSIEAPIFVVYGVFYILWLFGPMALLGIIAFLFSFAIQYVISRVTGYLRTKTMRITDMRIKLVNEILDCIKLIKMYAWEKRFSDDILRIRKMELRILLKNSYYQTLIASVLPSVTVISTIVTILAHVSTGNNLRAAQVFPYASFLEARLRWALMYLWIALKSIISANVSFDRMKSLLLSEDAEGCLILKPILVSQAVVINHGTFAYNNYSDHEKERSDANKEEKNYTSRSSKDKTEREKLNNPIENNERVLFDISFEAAKGKLVGICGHVGSGKSSLLLAALGQLRVSEGQVMRDGSCAYVSQQAWINNATLRENILFGAKFDQTRYYKTIYACSLNQDIDMMPGGDQTEIGEKGVNLSGGQKQRVALARALYADRDIYFLDDPLSAVDSRVGAFIFDNLILGALREKTVIFVTHQIQYLNRCDDIYMMRDGRILEHGTHDELMKLGNEYAVMVSSISIENDIDDETIIPDEKISGLSESIDVISIYGENQSHIGLTNFDITAESVEISHIPGLTLRILSDTQLIVDDVLEEGNIKARTYHMYIMAAGGYCFCFIVILAVLTSVGSIAFSSWWLAVWIEAGGGVTTNMENNVTLISVNINDNPDFSYYQSVYAGSIGIIILTSVVGGYVYTKATIRASEKIHNNIFKKIIASPMRFFDTTPSGRIQDMFSRNMDEVDNQIPYQLLFFVQILSRMALVVVVVCLVFPWFVLPVSCIAVIYYFVSKVFRIGIRDLKRMDNMSRAPVISFVTATIQGVSTIRAFGKEEDFEAKFAKLFDANSKCLFMFSIATRWLIMRVEALTVAITGITAFFVIGFKEQISPSLAGLALSYAAQASGILPNSTRIVSDTETAFTSVEKIDHYIRTLETEGSSNKPTVKLSSTWPAAAKIKFSNVCMAYGDDAPHILKNISFCINSGEKIGIVGRTGSGKSSLTVALFRLVELATGRIEIDDVDISKIGLNQLRMKLSIIPQDPVLFSGTIRLNLDPFKLYTDAEIWTALEKTQLKSRVHSIADHLDASFGFDGDNLSVGERQLLCLARALLRNSKILILDEATAAVDPETEIAVQKTVQQEFSNCTILTIAHRLQTVVSLDKVLVMDSGKVMEFDTPSNLLGDPSSEFSKMIAAAERAER